MAIEKLRPVGVNQHDVAAHEPYIVEDARFVSKVAVVYSFEPMAEACPTARPFRALKQLGHSEPRWQLALQYGSAMPRKKCKKKFTAAKEAKRRARLGAGTPPPGRIIPDKRSKAPKHKKRLPEESDF